MKIRTKVQAGRDCGSPPPPPPGGGGGGRLPIEI